MNPFLIFPYLMMHSEINGRIWNGPELRNAPIHRGGRKTFKMNRRKELKISARRKARGRKL